MYKLQRWWLVGGWKTVDSFETLKEAERALSSYSRQVRDGTFRILSSKGRTLRIRKGSLYKARKGKTMKLEQVVRR